MQLTRSEAIEMAVRRWQRLTAHQFMTPTMGLSLCLAYANVPLNYATAIRAHFRAVCRAYEVQSPILYTETRGTVVTHFMGEPDYDGHSLRL